MAAATFSEEHTDLAFEIASAHALLSHPLSEALIAFSRASVQESTFGTHSSLFKVTKLSGPQRATTIFAASLYALVPQDV
jgi:uncharacterized membrane protein